MSGELGFGETWGSHNYTTNDWSVMPGPQTDGTYEIPDVAWAIQPTDAGGGAPAQYSSGILDIFKFGVGVWQQQQNQQQLLDYRRFEATQKGLYQQGQPALFTNTANGQVSPTIWLFGGVIVLAAILMHKG